MGGKKEKLKYTYIWKIHGCPKDYHENSFKGFTDILMQIFVHYTHNSCTREIAQVVTNVCIFFSIKQDETMFMYSGLELMEKEMVVAYLKELSKHLAGRTEKVTKLQSG